ncbi:cysteine desulfurase [Candidatus Woesearchaeota archaeon]|nr:cysteine desulfurase [Candidatus Woesearchaeota archaeon]
MSNSKLKKDFPIAGKTHYLDSAAMALKPRQVIESVKKFMEESSVNVNRGLYTIAEKATEIFESSRENTAKFIGAKPEEIIHTSGTTMGINALAYSLQPKIKKGDIVLTTEMEHHSNLVPWQELCNRTGATLKIIPVKNFVLDTENFGAMLKNAKIFSCTHISNAIGSINPIKELFKKAKDSGTITILDAAQSVPHTKINVKKIGCDALVFSGHKIMAPTGIGILYVSKEHEEEIDPFFYGGKMINSVELKKSSWTSPPNKFEAGTPNIEGAVGLKSAIDYIKKTGIEEIENHVGKISRKIREELSKIPEVKIQQEENPKSSIISFTIKGVHPHDAASILNEHNICVRAGHHCAMPLMKNIGVIGTIRASTYMYNDTEDVNALVNGVNDCIKLFGVKK